jgi:acyl-CoA synthetase (AMP-forming)/AMP-acid ligase II
MPAFHCSGWNLAQIPALFAGGTVLFVPLFDAAETLRLIRDHAVTLVLAPPTFYVTLLQQPGFTPEAIKSLRMAASRVWGAAS